MIRRGVFGSGNAVTQKGNNTYLPKPTQISLPLNFADLYGIPEAQLIKKGKQG